MLKEVSVKIVFNESIVLHWATEGGILFVYKFCATEYFKTYYQFSLQEIFLKEKHV